MTPRSIRRAAERRAQKEARKNLQLAPAEVHTLDPEPDTRPPSPPSTSTSRQAANLRNAQLSTGPRTEAGKHISSLNAVKAGLTGRTVLLPSEDADAYRSHVVAYHAAYAPVGHRESELVQFLADTQWRLTRIPSLEMALYAKGRLELADSVSPLPDPALHLALLDLEIHLKYEKQLRNLQLQESRLHRRYTQDAAELRRLQAERRAQDLDAAERARKQPAPATQPPSGFVFSTDPALFATAAGSAAPALESEGS